MIVKLADNILSPLGDTAQGNLDALLRGESRLRLYDGKWGVPDPFVASLFEEGFTDPSSRYSRFEQLCIRSAAEAIAEADINPTSDRVLFIVSTTKGNVDMIDTEPERVPLGVSAQAIASYFGNPNGAIVVSNACISGANALLVGKRCIESGRYDYAVVTGCDVQSKFIISGFQSFKALSPEPCKPFDQVRQGLNLGEAAATMVLGHTEKATAEQWVIETGAVRNDANHISGPSRTGEGSYKCLRYVMQGIDPAEIAFINAHGTATPYNDEMESIAIDRAGLASVTVNAYKGYYGHTMGAAGVLESIISQRALDNNMILGTRGYESLGVSHPVKVTAENTSADGKRAFVKLLSGFGGCNVALLYRKGGAL